MAASVPASQYRALLAQLKALREAAPQDPILRRELYQSLHDTSLALESPLDTVRRVSFAPLQLSLAKVAINLKLFDTLVTLGRPASVKNLAGLTGANILLLRRILRYLASFGMVEEIGPDFFAASRITTALVTPGFKAGIEHHFDIQLPCWVKLPEFLATTAYKNPDDARNTAFQSAHATDQPAFVWALSRPRLFQDFNLWMSAQREGQPSWLDVFPLERLLQDPSSPTPLFVDVGGGVGHQCVALKRTFPRLTRRIILEDLAPAISHAIPAEGVEHLVHDFWTEQPIKGASYYYLRNVLHDYPDEKCVALLQRQLEAMAQGSALLIDEMVLPESRAHWQATELDVAMMSSLGSMERTEQQWKDLMASVGLTIKEKFTYMEELGNSVLLVTRS